MGATECLGCVLFGEENEMKSDESNSFGKRDTSGNRSLPKDIKGIGVQLYSLRDYIKNPRMLATALKEVSNIGYTAAELACIDDMYPGDVADVLKDSGLDIAAYHIPWVRFRTGLGEVIEELKLYGCENAVIPGVFSKEYRSLNGVYKFAEEIKEVSAKLKAEGISLSYHNHNHELCKYNNKSWLEILYESTTADELKAELDIFWIQAGGGSPASWIKKYKGRQRFLHLKDFVVTQDRLNDEALAVRLKAGVGAEQRVTEVGNGNIDFDAVFTAAGEAGVEYYIVEQDESFDLTAYQSIRISYENLISKLRERK